MWRCTVRWSAILSRVRSYYGRTRPGTHTDSKDAAAARRLGCASGSHRADSFTGDQSGPHAPAILSVAGLALGDPTLSAAFAFAGGLDYRARRSGTVVAVILAVVFVSLGAKRVIDRDTARHGSSRQEARADETVLNGTTADSENVAGNETTLTKTFPLMKTPRSASGTSGSVKVETWDNPQAQSR